MYQRVRRKMLFNACAIVLILPVTLSVPKTLEPIDTTRGTVIIDDNYENNIINFDEEYSVKFNKKYGTIPWHSNDEIAKDIHRYTIVEDSLDDSIESKNKHVTTNDTSGVSETTEETDYSVIPLELISTTDNYLTSIVDSTAEYSLSVIPLSTTVKDIPFIEINQSVTLPTSTQETEVTTEYIETTTNVNLKTKTDKVQTINKISITNNTVKKYIVLNNSSNAIDASTEISSTIETIINKENATSEIILKGSVSELNTTNTRVNKTVLEDINNKKNYTKKIIRIDEDRLEVNDKDVPVFTELDTEDGEVPEDYYDSKDVMPTTAPKTNALSVLVGLAGSVVESVAERVVPKGIYDLFKRMQRQNEALEAERLRSREENGGLGQFGRGILKSISSGISKPFSQLMAGVRDIGSLDTDRGFVSSLASGVSSVATVANSVADAFKDRVQAIYPGTVWCGDGHSATARSGELGLFFFTDTCCRQHDACKIYIKAGETKYGLTNTGLFTRSHCSCDVKFRECLQRTNSLVSSQIGLTYFNVLGPQCFRKAHPIVKCVRRTRITGQKCEEYELDYTKPKMWQWFDNETF